MFKITNEVSIEDAKRIRKEIHDAVDAIGQEIDKNFELYKIVETIACYALWIIKENESIVTYNDMTEKMKLETEWYLDDFSNLFLEYNSSFGLKSDPKEMYTERSEAWNKFKNLAKKYSAEELVAAICKADFIDDEYYEHYFSALPVEIGALVDGLLEVKEDESVVQIGASSYVFEALERNPTLHLTAQREEDFIMLTLIPIFADVLGCSNIDCTFSFNEGQKFRKAFVNNGLEPSERLMSSDLHYDLENEWGVFPRDVSEEWNTCATGILRTEDTGKVVAVMNAGELTLNKYRDVREFLCKGGLVEGVILLPDKMYANTWINPYLVIFSRNNKSVKFLDARNEYVANRKRGKRINSLDDDILDSIIGKYKSGESCIEVRITKMENSDYVLTPSRYVEVSDTNANKVKLGDVIDEIKRGITLSAANMDQMIMDTPSDIRCLLPADIFGGVVTAEKYFHGELRKPGKNEVHQGDILISKTGNPFRIAVADKNYLVVGNTYILDIDRTKISPEYVKCYLSSKAGQQELMKYASGSTTPIISVSNLGNIEIPMYDESTQKELNQHAKEIVSSLNESYKQIKICEEGMDSLFG